MEGVLGKCLLDTLSDFLNIQEVEYRCWDVKDQEKESQKVRRDSKENEMFCSFILLWRALAAFALVLTS